MNYNVRKTEKPYDKLGRIDAPAPEILMGQGGKHAFPIVEHMNDDDRHWTDPKVGELVLELGVCSHPKDCGCQSCIKGQRPPDEAAFIARNVTQEQLRHIRGFHPITVLDAKPATLHDDAPKALI